MRNFPAPLVALALLVAGCASSPGTTTSDPVLNPDVPFVLVESKISNTTSGPEPSLGVTREGILFTNLGSNVFRSLDNGTTWDNLGNPYPNVPNNDPDLAVDVDATVWESRLVGTVCNAVSVSQDLGATWSNNPAACFGPVHDRQYVIPTTGGTAYIYSHQLPTFQQLAMKTTDYGTTWLPVGPPEGLAPHHLLVNGGSGWGGGGFWNAKKDSVWFTFNYSEGPLGSGSHAGYSMTSDGGATWTFAQAAKLTGNQLGLGLVTGAADDAGNVYLTWGESEGGEVSIWLARSTDEGATWLPKIRVDQPETGSKVFPVVVAGSAGKVAVAYYEGSMDAHPDQMTGTWNVTLAWTHDALGNGTWNHHVLTSKPVKSSPICISGTTCTGNREFADYFDAVRMPDGRVAVTYNTLESGTRGNGFVLTGHDLLGAWPTA